jgi:hypothetical protein
LNYKNKIEEKEVYLRKKKKKEKYELEKRQRDTYSPTTAKNINE